jgi:uncharacterized protein (UPF0264 family)
VRTKTATVLATPTADKAAVQAVKPTSVPAVATPNATTVSTPATAVKKAVPIDKAKEKAKVPVEPQNTQRAPGG